MKVQKSADVVIKVPRYGTLPAPPAVIDAAKKLVEREGGHLRAEETIDPHSPEGEAVVSLSWLNQSEHPTVTLLLTGELLRVEQLAAYRSSRQRTAMGRGLSAVSPLSALKASWEALMVSGD